MDEVPELSCRTTTVIGSTQEAKVDLTTPELSFTIRLSFQCEIFPRNMRTIVLLESTKADVELTAFKPGIL